VLLRQLSVGQLKIELRKEIQSTLEEIGFRIELWKSQLRGIRQTSDKFLVDIEQKRGGFTCKDVMDYSSGWAICVL